MLTVPWPCRRFARIRLLDFKRALQRHYCAMCQNVYCHWHTRISPHGAYGSCGVDSKCVCFKCFKLLSSDAQVRTRGWHVLIAQHGSCCSVKGIQNRADMLQ